MTKTTLMIAALMLSGAPVFAGGLTAPVMEAPVAIPTYEAPASQATWDGAYVGGSFSNLDFGDDSDVAGEDNVFGVHAGYNYDLGSFVVGGEVGYAPNGVDLEPAGEMKDSFSAKLRGGYDLGDVMVFGALGTEYATMDFGAGDVSDFGLLYGVGADYKLSKNVVIGAEADFHDFKDFDDAGIDMDPLTVGGRLSFTF